MTKRITYFSMEIGISPEIKTYSGGLGVLAGDTLKSAADLGLEMAGFTLLYEDGYFRQILGEDNFQEEEPQSWDYKDLLEDTGEKVTVEVKGEEVGLKIYRYYYEGFKGTSEIYFLDSDIEENSEEARKYTESLYRGDEEMRLCQEVILGIGGAKAVKKLGLEPSVYHMNEGHSALLTLEADGRKVFTTHTPVASGHDSFSPELVKSVLNDRVKQLDLSHELNMTDLALEESDYSNAVSEKHREVSEKMFPQHELDSITNGVHIETWASEDIKELFDDLVDNWREDSQRLTQALEIPDSDIWEAKRNSKKEMLEVLENSDFDRKTFTIGFARRATSYKRPTLIFKDLDRLDKLGEKYGGLQILMGGKAHPHDHQGKEAIQKIFEYGKMLEHVNVHFVEDYGIEDTQKMVAGVDLWLNNPVRGQEASGTSGMKAAANGTPQLSVLDGWWIEGHIEDVTGWSIGEDYVEGEDEDLVDSKSIYRKLDHIISIYQNDRQKWLKIMKQCIAVNASYFNTQRMVQEYLTKAYSD
jgi:starch phosphorylase